MDNSNTNPQPNTTNQTQKPTFLTSENPNVLKNVDIKTTSSNSFNPPVPNPMPEPQHDLATGYSSPYSSPYSASQQSPQQVQNQQSYQQQPFPVQQQVPPGNQQSQPSTFGKNISQSIPQSNENPFQTKTNVVYKTEEKGGGFIGRILKQMFSSIGCLLLVIAIVIIAFIYIINF